jgi:hypothetical protein
MCRIVAHAPLSGPGTSSPIAIAITTGPSLQVHVGLSDSVATYPGSTSSQQGGLGPTSDSFAGKQDAALETVTDIDGDGTPELILWTGEFADHNEFQVLTLNRTSLTPVDGPLYSKWGNRDIWNTYATAGGDYSYSRCAPKSPGTITQITGSDFGPAREWTTSTAPPVGKKAPHGKTPDSGPRIRQHPLRLPSRRNTHCTHSHR